jgi:Kef-type K+ transport system membrane component KefB
MTLSSLDLFHIVITLATLLVCAHLGGFLATRLGMPPMVGELAGGVVLGATVLARVAPDLHAWLLPAVPTGATPPPLWPVLAFCSQIGLLLLLFVGGLQLKRLLTGRDTAAIGWIAALGVIVPVAAGFVALQMYDLSAYMGPARHLAALEIVLLIELAITSIPVITRIFLDLGLMQTRLARIVLSVAVIEDVLLYIALSLALGMANASAKADVSIPYWLELSPDSLVYILWHVGASLTLLAAAAWGFGVATRSANQEGSRLNLIRRRSPAAWTLLSILVITAVAMLLGLAPMFGALVAGIVASNDTSERALTAQKQIEAVGLAFFVPIYFAMIGVSLDLVKDLDWSLTLGILVFGTTVKYGGALLGGLVAREPMAMAHALAASVNARGGPGLVVASTAFAAGIIDPRVYTSLVLLSILTSVGAGIYLARVLRRPALAALIRSDGTPEAARV